MFEIIFKYWIEILFGLIVSLISFILKIILDYKKKLNAANEGIIILLKIKIIEKYNDLITKDEITVEDVEGIIDLYNVYKKFECCDVVKGLMTKINNIPIK